MKRKTTLSFRQLTLKLDVVMLCSSETNRAIDYGRMRKEERGAHQLVHKRSLRKRATLKYLFSVERVLGIDGVHSSHNE